MSTDMIRLPGQETLLACWSALAQLSPGAGLTRTSSAVAAVFPEWEPLNNAILVRWDDDVAATAAASASDLARNYGRAGVTAWALWLPGRATDLDAADEVRH